MVHAVIQHTNTEIVSIKALTVLLVKGELDHGLL